MTTTPAVNVGGFAMGSSSTRAKSMELVVLTALILICSLTATPDLAACNASNAVTILRVPEEFGNPATCFMHGQAYLAETSIGRDLGDDERVKVVCTRSSRAAAAH